MANWVTRDWYASFETVDVIEVTWTREDSDSLGTRRSGKFQHTLDEGKSWLQNKQDVIAKVNAEEGLETT